MPKYYTNLHQLIIDLEEEQEDGDDSLRFTTTNDLNLFIDEVRSILKSEEKEKND